MTGATANAIFCVLSHISSTVTASRDQSSKAETETFITLLSHRWFLAICWIALEKLRIDVASWAASTELFQSYFSVSFSMILGVVKYILKIKYSTAITIAII
jgi:hypothetical protein